MLGPGEIAIRIALLSVGGALGVNARYWLGYWMGHMGFVKHFPYHTLVINVSGSLLLGVIAVLCVEQMPAERRHLYLLWGTGFCGGYTTFSTFELETLLMVENGKWDQAAAYVGGSVAVGLLALYAGVRLGRWLVS